MLVVMGIVITFVGPRVVGGLTGLNTRTATLKTAAMLRYARSKAVNTGCQYHVVFDGVDRRVIMLQAKPEDDSGSRSLDMPLDGGQGELEAQRLEQVFDDSDGARSAEAEQKIYPLPDGVLFENVFIAGIDSEDLGDEMIMMLSFYPNGTSLGADVTIADERGRRFFIAVAALSGSVHVYEEPDDD